MIGEKGGERKEEMEVQKRDKGGQERRLNKYREQVTEMKKRNGRGKTKGNKNN